MTRPIRLGLVGLGKIAVTQHLPVIGEHPALELVAVADPSDIQSDVPRFESMEEMIAACPTIDAVVLCQPPQARFAAARHALLTGKHVFMEKPPATGVCEIETLAAQALACGTTLFAAWHSREASGVREAKRRIGDGMVTSGSIAWKEDVRVWHPGQHWLWQPGGFGVFDPGINALSILTEVLPERVHVASAELFVPENCAAPIAANLKLVSESGAMIDVEFDFRQTGPQTWDIRIESGPNAVVLAEGGNILSVNGTPQSLEPEREYARLYERFISLVGQGQSDVDLAPLRLVADAFLKGRWIEVDRFDP